MSIPKTAKIIWKEKDDSGIVTDIYWTFSPFWHNFFTSPKKEKKLTIGKLEYVDNIICENENEVIYWM
jgi:hypothetical protein